MRFACRITKVTDKHTHTHTQFAILIAFFHGNNGWMNAPPCNVYTNTLCFVWENRVCKRCTRTDHFMFEYLISHCGVDDKEVLLFLSGEDYNPCFTNRYIKGYLQCLLQAWVVQQERLSLCHNSSIIVIQGVYKWMLQFQKSTRNLFLTLHGHNVHRQQRQLSKLLMRYQQFASHAYCGAAGSVSKMAPQQEKAFCVLRFEVSRSVITVQREFRAVHGLEKTHHAWCVFSKPWDANCW